MILGSIIECSKGSGGGWGGVGVGWMGGWVVVT